MSSNSFWKRLTPEERDEFVRKRAEKIRAAKERDKQGMPKVIPEAEVTLQPKDKKIPLGDHEKWTATRLVKIMSELDKDEHIKIPQNAFRRFSQMINSQGSIERVRTEYFYHVGNRLWEKFKKAFIIWCGGNTEDTVLSLMRSKEAAHNTINDQIKMLKEKQKDYPKLFAKEIIAGAKALVEIDSSYVRTLNDLASIGTKDKGIQINIINKIPRPEKQRVSSNKDMNKQWEQRRLKTIQIEVDKSNEELGKDLEV